MVAGLSAAWWKRDAANGCPVGTVAADCRHGCPVGVTVGRLSEPVTVATAHRNATGRGGESGRARTRRRHGNATAGGCGAFGGTVANRCPFPSEPVTVGGTVSRRVKCPCKGGASGAADCPNLSPSAALWREPSEPVGRLSEPVGVTVATAHRNGTGRGGESGRARTRPNGGNATAGGCGAFGANPSADYPNRITANPNPSE